MCRDTSPGHRRYIDLPPQELLMAIDASSRVAPTYLPQMQFNAVETPPPPKSNGPTSGPGHEPYRGKPDPVAEGRRIHDRVTEGGYQMVARDAQITYDDIRSVDVPGEVQPGYIRFITKDGAKHVVAEIGNPSIFAAAEQKYLDVGAATIDLTRGKADLPPKKDTDAFSLKTDIESGDEKLTIGQAAYKGLVDQYKKDDLEPDSDQAKLVRLLEARDAVSNGKFIKPTYEDFKPWTGTKTEVESLTQLEPADMKEIFDSAAINREIEYLMRREPIAKDFAAKLDEAVKAVPEADRKAMADKLAKVVESADYVAEISKLPSWDAPRARADVEDAISQLSLLDPDRARSAGQKFTANALAKDFDSAFADPTKVDDEALGGGVADVLETVKGTLDTVTGLPGEIGEQIDSLLGKDGADARVDAGKVAAELRANGYKPEDIDKAFSKVDFASGEKDSIRKLFDQFDSQGLLPAISGAFGLAGAVHSLSTGEFGTAEENLAVAGGLISFVGSLPDAAKVLPNLAGIDASALTLLGVDGKTQDAIGVGSAEPNSIVSKVGERVAATDVPEPTGVDKADEITKGFGGLISGNGAGADASRLSRSATAAVDVVSKFTGVAGGVLDVVTGGMSVEQAFGEDGSPGDRAEAVLSLISGSSELASAGANALSTFTSAAQGGQASTASRVLTTLSRGLSAVGVAAGVVGLLIGTWVQSAKDKSFVKDQYEWFKNLAGDGIARPDWNLKYDYAVTTLAEFRNAGGKNDVIADLSHEDWGGRQAPGDRSIFDFHREEFAHFREQWEKDRGAESYAPFLDPAKREADFKREKDHMDEVKAYREAHPTHFDGYNDWVLDL
jgi:hypothetical protein